MNRKLKKTYFTLGSSLVGVLAVVGVIWAASARVQSIEDRGLNNQNSIKYLDKKIDMGQHEIKQYLREMREDIRYIRRSVR